MTPSRRFLLATWGSPGDFGPMLAAGQRLRKRGHHVRFIGDSSIGAECEAAGFPFTPWRHGPSVAPISPEAGSGEFAAMTGLATFKLMCDRFMFGAASDYAQDILAEIAREPADAVLALDFLFGVAVGAEAAGVPCAFLSPHISIEPLPGLPPGARGLLPPRDAAERAENEAAVAFLRSLLNEGLPTLNAARTRLGLAPLAHVFDQFAAVERTLIALSPAFDFTPDWLPERIRYVGPLLDPAAWARPWTSPFAGRATRKLVLVSFSTTFQNQAAALQQVLDALGTLDVHGVVTLGPGMAGVALHPPANVALLESAPHDRVMREAALVITHGGHGTVARALAYGLPMLVLPMGRDQHDNAARVVARGAGLSLDAGAPSAAIREAVQRLLDEQGFRAAARDLGSAVAADLELPTLVEELERMAARGAPRTSVATRLCA